MIPAMNEKPKTKRPRKRWKRVLKWTLGAIFLALILWASSPTGRLPMTATATLLLQPTR